MVIKRTEWKHVEPHMARGDRKRKLISN